MARVVMDVFWCDVVPLELWLSVWLVEAGRGGGLLVPRTAHCPAQSANSYNPNNTVKPTQRTGKSYISLN